MFEHRLKNSSTCIDEPIVDLFEKTFFVKIGLKVDFIVKSLPVTMSSSFVLQSLSFHLPSDMDGPSVEKAMPALHLSLVSEGCHVSVALIRNCWKSLTLNRRHLHRVRRNCCTAIIERRIVRLSIGVDNQFD